MSEFYVKMSVCICVTFEPSAAALLARMASLSLANASSSGFSTSLSRMVTSSPKVRQLPVMNWGSSCGDKVCS